jgi:predicted phage terminase large subunit-like protein
MANGVTTVASNNDLPGGQTILSSQARALMRSHLVFFLPWVFHILHPGERPLVMNWYLHAICQALHKTFLGKIQRLVVNVPPRHLKSISAVAFTAWLLGRNARHKIMLVTYGSRLSQEHLANLVRIMSHPVYRMLFPETRLDPGISQGVLKTTAGGGCRTVTVGGATTGFGADYIIIDDAMKADDIVSEARREELDRFYRATLLTRFNDKRSGRLISMQQRLGEYDLPARLIEAGADHLCLPAWDDKEVVYDIGLGRIYRRPIGEVLRPDDEPREVLEEQRRRMGPRDFATQYLQLPGAIEGNIIRTDRFSRYKRGDIPRHKFHKVVQSWDTATSEEPRADFSVCLTFGFRADKWYLLDCLRERLPYPRLRDQVRAQQQLWRADKVVIEDAGAGQHLWQDMRQRGLFRPVLLRPAADKVTRMVGQLALIEDGDILLPDEAPWLDAFLSELKAFPTGRHDDQVDSLAQFLEWSKTHNKWANTKRDPTTGRKLFVQSRRR